MRVWIKRITPVFVLILAALMVTAGGILTAIMLGPYLRGEGGFTSYPAALVVGGLVIPFIVRRRYALHVQTVDGTFQWKPPILVDRSSRDSAVAFLGVVADTCRKAGLT